MTISFKNEKDREDAKLKARQRGVPISTLIQDYFKKLPFKA